MARVQLAITHDEARAKKRHPWARAFVEVKAGIWCFEDRDEAFAYRMSRTTGEPTPGTGKPPK